jgi:hypothetical protein
MFISDETDEIILFVCLKFTASVSFVPSAKFLI